MGGSGPTAPSRRSGLTISRVTEPAPPPDPRAQATDDLVLERVALFSDAVFAIAITLLALDLRLPDDVAGTNDAVVAALAGLVPAFWAFLLSFAVIAAFWIGHVRTIRAIVRTDPIFITLNLVFLAAIALLPFPTSVVARQGDVAAGAVFYAAFGTVTASLSTLLWVYATRIGRLASPAVTPRLARFVAFRAASVPVLFALSIPIALISPLAAWLVWVAVFPLQLLLARRYRIERELDLSLGGRRDRQR